MSLGKRVQQFRQEAGYSLRQLADEAGVSHSSLAKLEAGRVRGLHSDTLVAVAKVLNVSLDLLVYGSSADKTTLRARLKPADCPFPAYASIEGRISAVNKLLLQATGWPEVELVGARLDLARFFYPTQTPSVRERLMVTAGGTILVHRTESANVEDGEIVHLVRFCTADELSASADALATAIAGQRVTVAAALIRMGCLIRSFGMRGVSIAYVDPQTGSGARLINGQVESPPSIPAEQLEEMRRCQTLGVACEYLVPHLSVDALPWPQGYPARVLTVPVDSRVLSFGWAGDLTVEGFPHLAHRLAEVIQHQAPKP